MASQPKIQDLAQSFFETPQLYQGAMFNPKEDLYFDRNEQAFYIWNGQFWNLIEDGNQKTGALAKLLTDYLLTNWRSSVNITQNIIGELRLSIIKLLPGNWGITEGRSFAAFHDCLLNLKTMQKLPLGRQPFSFIHFPFVFDDLSKPTPVFDSFLKRAFPDSPAMQSFVLSVLGFLLSPSLEPYVVYVYGVANSGKSRFLDLIRMLVPDNLTCAFSLQSLTTGNFTVAELAGKLINILDEDESEYIRSDKLKALASHSRIQAERKYGQPFTMQPFAKFIFSSNQLPNFKNVDEGLKRRLIFIEFKNEVPRSARDRDLAAKFYSELPGIVGRAIAGMNAFYENNQEFDLPPEVLETLNDFLYETLPAVQFFRDHCQLLPKETLNLLTTEKDLRNWISNDNLYRYYKEWSKENGKIPLNSINFHRQLSKNIPQLETRFRWEGAKNLRVKNCSCSLSDGSFQKV